MITFLSDDIKISTFMKTEICFSMLTYDISEASKTINTQMFAIILKIYNGT